MFTSSTMRYTEAILLCPDWPVLFINRALCQKQRGDWKAVEIDSRKALELQPRVMKALELAREQGDLIRDQIWRELAKVKYANWEIESATRRAEQKMLQERLSALLEQDHRSALSQAGDQRVEVQQRHDHELAALKRLFELGAKSYKEYEPDNAYTCRLTMEVGKFDPVTRKAMNNADAIPNLALRAATEHYLDDNPWAWKDVC
ncbi:hypothetical protein COCSUDRAFT_56812 [Coccomyxa subellipsoidea C-169]|uniref:RING-type E3 ubiquitin transferase n=1 Tax=Coccomyxa subellipsoidea (strain C-169) TaxID=574566 RepID=I0YT86_COCSC|nr:hypothetical protein COCSUDRAFT_56812 [Coccomyxa subellipsoidea C-169]EIE21605.1 hypothetical protein COCSUDRAFT_56812 [Coccomyxa subellipsoidea C-169]|eukprot:XP_005646149.1 hypothetical protein COCSUDRAFT_56812 [Coccomyxa subellipsoidea C-169]